MEKTTHMMVESGKQRQLQRSPYGPLQEARRVRLAHNDVYEQEAKDKLVCYYQMMIHMQLILQVGTDDRET